jgi:hypothetical protein
MPLRANFQKSYSIRYSIMAGVCLFMTVWFLYDGLVGYPNKRIIAEEFDKIREMGEVERTAKWREIAAERGWGKEPPEKTAEEISEDISGQFVWAGLAFCAGFPALIFFLRTRGTWVEETPSGLTTSWGQTVNFANVSILNKKRWRDKGIAKATYTSDGVTKRFVFDDFKYDREPLGKMLRTLESRLQADQIIGGPPEGEPSEPSSEEAVEE